MHMFHSSDPFKPPSRYSNFRTKSKHSKAGSIANEPFHAVANQFERPDNNPTATRSGSRKQRQYNTKSRDSKKNSALVAIYEHSGRPSKQRRRAQIPKLKNFKDFAAKR